jgi:hypothetical protein
MRTKLLILTTLATALAAGSAFAQNSTPGSERTMPQGPSAAPSQPGLSIPAPAPQAPSTSGQGQNENQLQNSGTQPPKPGEKAY